MPQEGSNADLENPDASAMPVVVDQEGYVAQACDISFVGLDQAEFAAMSERSSLLGLSKPEYAEFRTTLRDAMVNDQVEACDVRVQGSAAHFFSKNPKKRFPKSIEELAIEAAELGANFEQTEARWQGRKAAGDLPNRHYWDSRAKLYARKRAVSDYDIQISCDAVFQRLAALAAREPEQRYWSNLGCWRHQAIVAEFRALTDWALTWEVRTGRLIRLVAFGTVGPTGLSAFSAEDWVI